MLISPESVKLKGAVVPTNKRVTEEIQPINGTTCKLKGQPLIFISCGKIFSYSGNVLVYDRFPDSDFSVFPANASVEKGKEEADALVKYFVDFSEEFKKIWVNKFVNKKFLISFKELFWNFIYKLKNVNILN